MLGTLASGIEVQVSPRPAGSDGSLPSGEQSGKSLNSYPLLLAPGLLGGLLAYVIYPPLDSGPLMAFGLCIFLLPFVLKLSSVVRKRLGEDAGACGRFTSAQVSLSCCSPSWSS
jgi:hypothetical protein